jgi:hypothetical protein
MSAALLPTSNGYSRWSWDPAFAFTISRPTTRFHERGKNRTKAEAGNQARESHTATPELRQIERKEKDS